MSESVDFESSVGFDSQSSGEGLLDAVVGVRPQEREYLKWFLKTYSRVVHGEDARTDNIERLGLHQAYVEKGVCE